MSDQLTYAIKKYEPIIKLSDVYDVALYERRAGIEDNVEKSCSEPEIQMSDELTNAVKKYDPKIILYDVALYEGRARIEDNKFCLEPGVHMSNEFNSAVEQHKPNIQLSNVYGDDALYEKSVQLKQSAVKKNISNKNKSSGSSDERKKSIDSSDELEMDSSDKSEADDSCDSSDSSNKNEKSVQLKQSAVKKNISNKNKSSGSSDERKKSIDSSDEWEMDSSDKSEADDSRDSSYSSNKNKVAAKKKKTQQSKVPAKKKETHQSKVKELSEYEKRIQKNRDEKMAFLQSLRMNEVKEDLNEAIKNLKPPKQPKKRTVEWPKHPVRKSVRLKDVHFDFSEETLRKKAFFVFKEEIKEQPKLPVRKSVRLKNVHFDFSEETLERKAFHGIEEEMKEKSPGDSKSYHVQDESESSDGLEELSNTSDVDKDLSECSLENEVMEISEYEKKMQKRRDEKMAILQPLRINEGKDLNEAIMNLKPPEMPQGEVVVWPKHPGRKSAHLKEVHLDFPEITLE